MTQRCVRFVQVTWDRQTRCALTAGHAEPCAIARAGSVAYALDHGDLQLRPTGYQQTSLESYEATRHATGHVANRIRDLYRDHGPMTDELLFEWYFGAWGGYRNTVLPCRNALLKSGEVRNTGRRATVRSGRTAIVWELVG